MHAKLRTALAPTLGLAVVPAAVGDNSGGFDASWNALRDVELRSAVEKFYTDTFNDDAQIRRYFAPGYVQHVDGKTLRFDEFLTHLGFLRRATKSLCFEVIDALYTEGLLADRHRVHFVKDNGETAEVEVLAFLRIEDGRIVELNELTQVIRGDEADRALGSRLC